METIIVGSSAIGMPGTPDYGTDQLGFSEPTRRWYELAHELMFIAMCAQHQRAVDAGRAVPKRFVDGFFDRTWEPETPLPYSEAELRKELRRLTKDLAAAVERAGLDSSELWEVFRIQSVVNQSEWPRIPLKLLQRFEAKREFKPPLEPLTDQQQEVFEYIREHGPKTGKEICKALGIESQSTFTRHYVPALKKHGIRNKRGAGYFYLSS